ncbi:MAG: winged helix-turn-helix transcriptional regulator [Alphaproteobacteria bacterium]|nr:winged helix-turn-helix transcriptional regulator [Alphaproteobacteria bacterium]
MSPDTLSPTLAALADPTRRAILARLAQGQATVSELTEPLDISMPAVSRHLKVLERAGLIERGRDAQYRPCRLRPEGLAEVQSWMDALRAEWVQRLDRLEAYLAELQDAPAVDLLSDEPSSSPSPEVPDDD